MSTRAQNVRKPHSVHLVCSLGKVDRSAGDLLRGREKNDAIELKL